jgi:hypothetical protein
MRRRSKIAVVIASVVVLTAGAGYGVYKYSFPYGYSHCCDKMVAFSLLEYARTHDGCFPKGETTPEASLSLLYRQDPNLMYHLRGKTVPEEVVRSILESGNLLSPETCGWHYVEGLRSDDDPKLALFWDKAGLGHFGERISDGGHSVGFVNGMVDWVPGDQWEQFEAEQARLQAGLKRK